MRMEEELKAQGEDKIVELILFPLPFLFNPYPFLFY